MVAVPIKLQEREGDIVWRTFVSCARVVRVSGHQPVNVGCLRLAVPPDPPHDLCYQGRTGERSALKTRLRTKDDLRICRWIPVRVEQHQPIRT
jgi:hypothetical protein